MAQQKRKSWLMVMAVSLMAGCFLYASAAIAQLSPVANASIIRNFARISLQHDPQIKLRSAVKGRQIRLRFDQPVTVNAAPLLAKLRPYVLSISQSADKRSLLITTNREYRIRSFVSGNRSGVDIIGLEAGGVTTPPPEPAKAAAPKPAPTPASPAALRKPSKPVLKQVTPSQKPERAETPEPAEAEEPFATTPEPAPEPEPETEPATEIESPAEPETPEPKAPEPAPKPGDSGEPVEFNPEPQKTAAPVSKVEVKEAKDDAASLALKIEKREDGIALIFPREARSAMAAFRRDNRHLLVFDSPQPLNAKAAREHPAIRAIRRIPLDTEPPAELWEIETDLPGMIVSKPDKSYDWRVELLDEPSLPAELLKPQPQVEPPLKPHLFIPVLEAAKPIETIDPQVGDPLIFVPFYKAGLGLQPPRRFAEFAAIGTPQGLVVTDPITDLRVARTRSGLKITSPEGILISADLPPVELPEPALEEGEAGESYFPYQHFKAPEDYENPADYEDYLWRQTASRDKKQRRLGQRKLAEYFLAQGRGLEAQSILGQLAEESPIYFTRNKLHALLGGAYFLGHRYAQAETAFKHPTLEGEEETAFWLDMMNILLRGEGAADYLGHHGNYIRHYPPLMRQRLAMIAANHLIDRKKYNRALRIFDTLQRNDMLPDFQDHMQYLIGRVLAGTTQKDAARTMWKRLIEESEDRFIRSRALYAMINLDLAENKLTVEEALKALDPLRLLWRGDEFEITLLKLQAKLHEEIGDYRNALRNYREIITYFPNREENIALTGRMTDIFRQLFNQGAADNLTPLEALALYYEFRNLTPIGKAGDQMIRNLADRLAAVDLLDRAAGLLQHQVEFRLSGEERSRIGAQLALIHLLRRKPREALKTLELTGFGANPDSLQQQRALLTARALMDLNEPDRALGLLKGDDSREARLLALEIHWKEQRWKDLIRTSESLLSQRDDPSLPLNTAEIDVLMKLAIGYIFDKQPAQLQYLRDYFLPLIEDEKSRKFFDFLSEDTPLDYRNLARLTAQIDRMESFLANYRNKIKQDGLSGAVE